MLLLLLLLQLLCVLCSLSIACWLPADWLLLTASIFVLILKRKEVVEAHAAPQLPPSAFPQQNPMTGAGGTAPAVTAFPLYPAASQPAGYVHDTTYTSYPDDSQDVPAASSPQRQADPFANKGYAADSPSAAVV